MVDLLSLPTLPLYIHICGLALCSAKFYLRINPILVTMTINNQHSANYIGVTRCFEISTRRTKKKIFTPLAAAMKTINYTEMQWVFSVRVKFTQADFHNVNWGERETEREKKCV